MALYRPHTDSFAEYDKLDEFLYCPLPGLLGKCGNNLAELRRLLRVHNQSIKGEIRSNCQSHNKRKNIVDYLHSITSKLKELDSQLMAPAESVFGRKPLYPINTSEALELEFMSEIRLSFDSLYRFLDTYPVGDFHPANSKATTANKKSTTTHPPSFSLDKTVIESTFKDCFVELQSAKFFPDDTTIDQFMACFGGDPVPSKVRWKRQNALYYFIKQLNQKEYIRNIPNGIWETASECFADKNGDPLDPGNLGRTKPLVNVKSRKIDAAIDLIKKNTCIKNT